MGTNLKKCWALTHTHNRHAFKAHLLARSHQSRGDRWREDLDS